MGIWWNGDEEIVSTRRTVQSIPIEQAWICEDCQCVNNSFTNRCIQCNGIGIENLGYLLRRRHGYCQVARNSSTR